MSHGGSGGATIDLERGGHDRARSPRGCGAGPDARALERTLGSFAAVAGPGDAAPSGRSKELTAACRLCMRVSDRPGLRHGCGRGSGIFAAVAAVRQRQRGARRGWARSSLSAHRRRLAMSIRFRIEARLTPVRRARITRLLISDGTQIARIVGSASFEKGLEGSAKSASREEIRDARSVSPWPRRRSGPCCCRSRIPV